MCSTNDQAHVLHLCELFTGQMDLSLSLGIHTSIEHVQYIKYSWPLRVEWPLKIWMVPIPINLKWLSLVAKTARWQQYQMMICSPTFTILSLQEHPYFFTYKNSNYSSFPLESQAEAVSQVQKVLVVWSLLSRRRKVEIWHRNVTYLMSCLAEILLIHSGDQVLYVLVITWKLKPCL